MSCLISRLQPERALILEGDQVRACHGLEADEVFCGAPISLSLLEDVRTRGEPLLIGDARTAPQYKDSWSLLLSGIRSVLCVPFLNPAGSVQGLLYADSRTQVGCFNQASLELVVRCARLMEAQLYEGDTRHIESRLPPLKTKAPPFHPPPPARRPSKPSGATAAATVAPLNRERQAAKGSEPARLRLREADKVNLMRSLAACLDSGICLSNALELLASGGPPLDKVCLHLFQHVQRGQRLTDGMAQCSAVFSPTDVALVRIAERTGALHRVLGRLAIHQEKLHANHQKLISSLVYPAFTLAFCLVIMVILPPYVLEGQFQFLRSSGQPIPWLTQTLMNLAGATRSAPVWLGVALLLGAVGGIVRSHWHLPVWQRRWWRMLLSLPGIGRVLLCFGACRLARSLALMLDVNYTLLEALPLAAAASSNPLLLERAPLAVESLTEGASLSESLGRLHYLPKSFTLMLASGDEIGKTTQILAWLGDFYEREYEAALEGALAMLEPLIMVGLSLLAGLTIVATMLPMVQAIATL